MKIVYIAHPLSGDLKNVDKVLHICRFISMSEPEVVPFAHWVVEALALNDQVAEERAIGIKHDEAIIDRLKFDECRLYGDRISAGMANEVQRFKALGVPVVPMTDETRRDLAAMDAASVDNDAFAEFTTCVPRQVTYSGSIAFTTCDCGENIVLANKTFGTPMKYTGKCDECQSKYLLVNGKIMLQEI